MPTKCFPYVFVCMCLFHITESPSNISKSSNDVIMSCDSLQVLALLCLWLAISHLHTPHGRRNLHSPWLEITVGKIASSTGFHWSYSKVDSDWLYLERIYRIYILGPITVLWETQLYHLRSHVPTPNGQCGRKVWLIPPSGSHRVWKE